MADRRRLADMPPAQQAGILSNNAVFRAFVSAQLDLADHGPVSASAAAEYVRDTCGVTSRADLNTNTAARARFDRLVTDFDAWRGFLPNPNPGTPQ
jgi:hypothetical protein